MTASTAVRFAEGQKAQAAEEPARGLKALMLDSIGKHVKDTAKVMFVDARKAVIDGVGGLLDALRRPEQEMGQAITERCAFILENVTNV